jgi:hypothetical protein
MVTRSDRLRMGGALARKISTRPTLAAPEKSSREDTGQDLDGLSFPESMEDEAGMQRRGQPNTELATKATSSDPARGRKGDFFSGASTPRPKDPNSTNGGGAQLERTRDRRRWKPSANESLKRHPSEKTEEPRRREP